MSDLDRLLQQVEELKRLASRPDDSWMESMSTEELQALGKRVRKVADGLSTMQNQLSKGGATPNRAASRPATSAGSLGSVVRRDTGVAKPGPSWAPPPPAGEDRPSARSLFPSTGAADMGNPIRRKVGGGAQPPPEGPTTASGSYRPNIPGPTKRDTPRRNRPGF